MICLFLLSIFFFVNASCSQLNSYINKTSLLTLSTKKFLPNDDILKNKIDLPDEKIDLPDEKIDLSPTFHVKQSTKKILLYDLSWKKNTKDYDSYAGIELTQYNSNSSLEEGEIPAIHRKKCESKRPKKRYKKRKLNNHSPNYVIRKTEHQNQQKNIHVNPAFWKELIN